jgi:hypothetical protein
LLKNKSNNQDSPPIIVKHANENKCRKDGSSGASENEYRKDGPSRYIGNIGSWLTIAQAAIKINPIHATL